MSKTYISLLAILLFFSAANAQLPELSVTLKSSARAVGIEKARALYYEANYTEAEALFYIELENGNFKPHDFLLFANTLILNNKPALSAEFVKEYENASGKTNISKQMQQGGTSSSLSVKTIQTVYPVSNPTSYRGNIYTCIGGKVMEYDIDCDGNLTNPREVLVGITDMAIGSVAFYNNGNNAVVSLIDASNHQSALYLVKKKKGKWKKPVKLFKSMSGNSAFPQIDEEHSKLYFSSDRPDGQGGYDLFVSVYNGEVFENPISLGNEVNTPGNEINPIMTQDWLYFSSDGHASKGGFDIYKFKDLGNQQTILLNATELNTTYNEVAFLPTSENSFYIKRENKEQTQLFSVIKQATLTKVIGTVTDENGEPVSGAYVLIGGPSGGFTSTDKRGNYTYKSTENLANIDGRVLAEGYEPKTFSASESQNINVQLTKTKPVEIIKEVIRTISVNQIPSETDTQVVKSDSQSTTILDVESTVNKDVPVTETSKVGGKATSPEEHLYYIILESTYDYAQAYEAWNKWLPRFIDAEILEFEKGLYRIGFFAGTNEENAVESYNEAKKTKKDIWILRPQN